MKRIIDRIFRKKREFTNSTDYWRERYRRGGNSGAGSYNHLAEFKAEVLNKIVVDQKIDNVIEFGSGDGNQLTFANYPKYTGFDVSKDAIALCKAKFSGDNTKTFVHLEDYDLSRHQADLALSLDVIFHLIEDDVFDDYMRRLFDSSRNLVVIYSSNTDDNSEVEADHVKHRQFTRWIDAHQSHWRLVDIIKNKYPYDGNHELTSFADFFVFQKLSELKQADVPRS